MTPLEILLPTDVFPPKSGGAGWSAHALALALQQRGHRVTAIVLRRGRGITTNEVLGVPTVQYGYYAPEIPFVKNYFRHELLWRGLADEIISCRRRAASQRPTIIHAQHVQVTPAAVMAGQRLGVPVLATVRDHWPWDYFATGLHGDHLPYGRGGWHGLATDLPARLGPLRGAVALPAIPYMLAHLRRRQAFLCRCDAVIAVSRYIAGRLSGIVPPERIHVIPNMVDYTALERTIAVPPTTLPPGQPFLLFVGKLERNKGAHLLLEVFAELQRVGELSALAGLQLVICGDGPLRGTLERGLAALGVAAHFLDWAEHDEVLRLMAHCELLLFPSAWGDPLSRVLLEAATCGAPILAMPTGGTPDIIVDGVSGALAATPQQFARRLSALLADPAARRRFGARARQMARERFAVERVAPRVEALYEALLRR